MKTKTTKTEYALCVKRDDGTWRAVGSARYSSPEQAEAARKDYELWNRGGNFLAFAGCEVKKRCITIVTTDWED